jgi:RNA polymerase sigma factor (TIGR02999 family)
MPGDVQLTQVLGRIERGEARAVRELFPLVYDELRRLAALRMAGERRDHTLQATALVHEAYAKISDGAEFQWQSLQHFYNAAAEAMRQILVDHARRKSAEKRGGDRVRVDLDHIDAAQVDDAVDLEGLDVALGKLQKQDPRRHQVVMYRFFAGLSELKTAELLGVGTKTVQRDWKTAKMFLFAEMGNGNRPEAP